MKWWPLLAGVVGAGALVALREQQAGGEVPSLGFETTPGQVPYVPDPATDFETLPGPIPWGDFVTVPGLLPGGHNEYDNQVRYAASTVGLGEDPAFLVFLKATIQRESGWNAQACGDCGRAPLGEYLTPSGRCRADCWSIGLMQVNRQAHPDLAASYDLLDPNENILAGAQIAAGAWRRAGGNPAQARTYYRGGPDPIFVNIYQGLLAQL